MKISWNIIDYSLRLVSLFPYYDLFLKLARIILLLII